MLYGVGVPAVATGKGTRASHMQLREKTSVGDIQRLEPPDTSRLELFLAGVKAAAAFVPFFGGSIAEAIGYFGQREIDKRQNAFAAAIVRGFEVLQVDVANLKESTWTTILHAAEVARRTHQEEKLDALRNAVLNSALPGAPDDDVQLIFLNLVDGLTPTHLRILRFLDGPLAWMKEHGKTIPGNPFATGLNLIDYAMPEVEIRRGFFSGIPDEMVSRGLLDKEWDENSSYYDPQVKGGSRTTPLGKAFLAFITSPIK